VTFTSSVADHLSQLVTIRLIHHVPMNGAPVGSVELALHSDPSTGDFVPKTPMPGVGAFHRSSSGRIRTPIVGPRLLPSGAPLSYTLPAGGRRPARQVGPRRIRCGARRTEFPAHLGRHHSESRARVNYPADTEPDDHHYGPALWKKTLKDPSEIAPAGRRIGRDPLRTRPP